MLFPYDIFLRLLCLPLWVFLDGRSESPARRRRVRALLIEDTGQTLRRKGNRQGMRPGT